MMNKLYHCKECQRTTHICEHMKDEFNRLKRLDENVKKAIKRLSDNPDLAVIDKIIKEYLEGLYK